MADLVVTVGFPATVTANRGPDFLGDICKYVSKDGLETFVRPLVIHMSKDLLERPY